jgi:hypothetical protein
LLHLVREPAGQRPLQSTSRSFRPSSKWLDNIIIYLQETDWETWSGFISLDRAKQWWKQHCSVSHEPSGLIKCGEYLDWLRKCLLLNKDSAPCSNWLTSNLPNDSLWFIQLTYVLS